MKRRDFLAVAGVTASQFFARKPLAYGTLLFPQSPSLHSDTSAAERLWPTPEVLPLATFVAGTVQPHLSLDGTWEILAHAPTSYGSDSLSGDWREVAVPGQADKQGVSISRDQLYAYRKKFLVPPDFRQKRIFLRFESVSGIATPWINGVPLEPHHGGFTIWSREITDHVVPGAVATLAVGVVDPDPRQWSSSFDYGGICRGVQLVAAPPNYLTAMHIHADLDHRYRDAALRVEVRGHISVPSQVRLEITDPSGSTVPGDPALSLEPENGSAVAVIPLPAATKWDAEHPHLYRVQAHLITGAQHTETIAKHFGVRKIERSGKRVLVNGSEIKLRGGGRFDSNPLLGHTLSRQQCEEEVRLFKEANVNYIRPACYPASESYLEACDRYGIYVEGETSVTFTRGSESDPALAALFMNQMASMIEANRDHPSILHWSLGNESDYGVNIARTFAYTQAADPSRPVLFSWSHDIPLADPLPYSIYSYHYPDVSDDLGKPGVAVFNGTLNRAIPEMPVLHDEFAHGPCYDLEELRRDPNVHNFWGESIRMFWEKMYRTAGCLGGGIWALVSEPALGTRVYDWGMVDIWRRKKPEYWLMKKAYSPVRLADQPIRRPPDGEVLRIPISNWHCHTNLNELTVHWSLANKTEIMPGPDLAPGQSGDLIISGQNWQDGELLSLEFFHGTRSVDQWRLRIGAESDLRRTDRPAERVAAPQLKENQHGFTVAGANFEVFIDKATGQFTADAHGRRLIESGPVFHLIGSDLGPWQLLDIQATRDTDAVRASIRGACEPVQVRFTVAILGDGSINLEYLLEKFPLEGPQTRLVPWNRTNAGGFSEAGVKLLLTPEIKQLDWERIGLYSVYPEDHIGRNSGYAYRTSPIIPAAPGQKPTSVWALDTRDYNLFGAEDHGGRGTNDFRSMKEYIRHASARVQSDGPGVAVDSDGLQAVRLEIPDNSLTGAVALIVNDFWNYTQLGLGNYMKPPIQLHAGYKGKVAYRLV